MASADQIKALIRSHADGDDARFYAVALQVAAQAARTGHSRFAQELRELIDRAKARAADPALPRAKTVPLVQPRGELAGVLAASYPQTRLRDLVVAPHVRERLERVVVEQRQREELGAHGFAPIKRVLLVGPPGTGKTLTAGALAGELALALFSIQLDGIITKFMGETAAKLRLVFEAMAQTRAVYLFDEFDALGGDRAAGNDVGEIRRVLNSFLVMLEQDQSDSVVVAATNHPALLDRALFRRFDTVIEYSLPTAEDVEAVARARLAMLDTSDVAWAAVREAGATLSHAEVTRSCEDAAKAAILSMRLALTTDDVVSALRNRRTG
ncbi:MAG: ATP-binding protein [Sandaracinus sp.]